MLSSTFHRHPANVFIINIVQSSFVSTLSSPELSCQYQHCQIIYGMNASSHCHHVNPIMITTPNQIIANVPSFIMLPSSHYNIVTLQQHCYHQHIKMTVNIVISNVITNIDMLSPSLSVRRLQELITNALVKQQCNNQMVIERCYICHCHRPYHAWLRFIWEACHSNAITCVISAGTSSNHTLIFVILIKRNQLSRWCYPSTTLTCIHHTIPYHGSSVHASLTPRLLVHRV